MKFEGSLLQLNSIKVIKTEYTTNDKEMDFKGNFNIKLDSEVQKEHLNNEITIVKTI